MLVGYAEGDAPVVPSQKATQGVIRVHNYHGMRASRYGSLQAVINIRRVRIAKHGIPRQVADQNIIRLKRRNIPKRDQLVHFDHRCILGCTIPNTDCIQKASAFVEQRRLIDTSRNRYFLGQIYSLRSTRSV